MRWLAPLLLCSGCGLVLGLDDYRSGDAAGGGLDVQAATQAPSSSIATSGGGGAGAGVSNGGGSPKMLGDPCLEGSECASTFCADGVCCSEICVLPCAKCNSAGACVAEPSTVTCGAYYCDGAGTACPITCGETADCAPNFFCDVGVSEQCLANNGAAYCNTNMDCSSGDCDGGVCCISTCTGECRSCNSAHTGVSNGYCGLITSGDPEGECALSCGTGCVCSTMGACTSPSQ